MSDNSATENPNDKMPPGKPLDPDSAVPAGEDAPEKGGSVGPEDEKREAPDGEPSAAETVKRDAQRRDRLEAGRDAPSRTPTGGVGEGTLMGLDAPGFGARGAADLDRMAAPDANAGRDDAIVDAEFEGMDNDLIDMRDFGDGGTGSGTQGGGAGERLQPTAGRAARPPNELDQRHR